MNTGKNMQLNSSVVYANNGNNGEAEGQSVEVFLLELRQYVKSPLTKKVYDLIAAQLRSVQAEARGKYKFVLSPTAIATIKEQFLIALRFA